MCIYMCVYIYVVCVGKFYFLLSINLCGACNVHKCMHFDIPLLVSVHVSLMYFAHLHRILGLLPI